MEGYGAYDLPLGEAGLMLAKILLGIVGGSFVLGLLTLPFFLIFLWLLERFLTLTLAQLFLVKCLLLMLRSMLRGLVRTSLTFLATFVLVSVITAIWSILSFISDATSEKQANLKAIVTEKFRNPSGMPRRMKSDFVAAIDKLPQQYRPKKGDDDVMFWQFFVGSMDPNVKTLETMVFAFVMEPRKLATMMDELDELQPGSAAKAELDDGIAAMQKNLQGILLGHERLRLIKKKVGDKFSIYSNNYKDITLELEIVGTLPEGRWDQSAIINDDYLNRELDNYKQTKGVEHTGDKTSISLIWVRLPSKEAFQALSELVNDPKTFETRLKVETASSAIGGFLDAFKDIFRGMKLIVSPAILATMCLIVSVVISISVRERRTEMAVMKVLGFRPNQVMLLLLGEAILTGVLSGTCATTLIFMAVNATGGIKFPIGFFPSFLIPPAALWWGPALGFSTSLLGAMIPALQVRKVKASEVFSKVT